MLLINSFTVQDVPISGDKSIKPASAYGPFSIPRAYEVNVAFRTPYSGLVENLHVIADKDQGAQRIEYYPGEVFNSVHIFRDDKVSKFIN